MRVCPHDLRHAIRWFYSVDGDGFVETSDIQGARAGREVGRFLAWLTLFVIGIPIMLAGGAWIVLAGLLWWPWALVRKLRRMSQPHAPDDPREAAVH